VSGEPFVPADPKLIHASDLIALVRAAGTGSASARRAAPKKLRESHDLEHEFRYMQLKVDSGADFLITQLFFDNRFYFDLVARARARGSKSRSCPG